MRIKLAIVLGMLLIGSACAAPAPPSTTTTTAPPVDDPALNVVLAAGGGTIFNTGQEQTFTIASPIDASQIQGFGLRLQGLRSCEGSNFGVYGDAYARVYGLIETVVEGVPRTMRVFLFGASSITYSGGATVYWSQPVPPTLELVVDALGNGSAPSCDFEVALWGTRG